MNSWEASCGTPTVHERIVSMSFAVWTTAVGAAHPNMFFKTFAFTLSPVSQISTLQSIFSEPDEALVVIQRDVRHQLLHANERFPSDEGAAPELDEEWVNRGTASWEDLVNFVFEPDGIEFLFSPYQVAAYVHGPQFAKIEYKKLAKLMHRDYAFALGVEHMQRDRL